jgi:hypothetical protein
LIGVTLKKPEVQIPKSRAKDSHSFRKTELVGKDTICVSFHYDGSASTGDCLPGLPQPIQHSTFGKNWGLGSIEILGLKSKGDSRGNPVLFRENSPAKAYRSILNIVDGEENPATEAVE